MIGAVLGRRVLLSTARNSGRLALARYYASFPSHTVVKMPALSPTMTAGGIGAWQKKPGDTIAPGEVLVEIETDKAQMDFEFQEEGVIAKILKDAGEKDVPVGSVGFSPSSPSLSPSVRCKSKAKYNLMNGPTYIAHRCSGRRRHRHCSL